MLPSSEAASGGFAVPFDQHVAAAAFRRGAYAYVVFDQARPIDVAGLRNGPVLVEASVSVLAEATVIRFRLPAGRGIALAPAGERWVVKLTALAIPPHPISPRLQDSRLLFALDQPGAVVAVPDTESGALLLVGTQHSPGQGVAASRRTPGFVLLPSWQGIALEPFSDALTLAAVPAGFALSAAGGLSLLPRPEADAQSDAVLLSRRYDFPALPPDALLQRLKTQIDSSAEAPPLARAPLRRLAAQTLIALGMGAEAQGLLDLATHEDPRAAQDLKQIGLSAIAALLAGRMQETEGLEDPRLADTDEVALWRAARLAVLHEASPEAAATFAATLPLALAYPTPLRAHLLPLIAETMAGGGEAAAAKALLARLPDDPTLRLARAMLSEAQGDTEAALAGYRSIADTNDRLASARAAWRAIELRLATHALDAAGAAAAYEKQLASWRGDDREVALRLRLVDLWVKAGQWRSAFALLRETATAFPDTPALADQARTLFGTFAQGDQGGTLSPLDFVAFVDENADLMPGGAAGDALADRVADRLAQLDLPTRAGPLLQKLIDHAHTPQARAAFGARLAEVRFGAQDSNGARAALAATDAPNLPAPLAERRALVAARAAAQLGDIEGALASLDPVHGTPALSARAQILEEAKDWPRAVSALSDLVAQAVPPDGAVDDSQRRLLLRLAAAAAAAGDTGTLTRLREHDLPRIGNGTDADMLRVLTEAPVTGIADLSRARNETQVANSLASRLAQVAAPVAQSGRSAQNAGVDQPDGPRSPAGPAAPPR